MVGILPYAEELRRCMRESRLQALGGRRLEESPQSPEGEPQGILIPPPLDGSGLAFEELLQEVPMWHIIDEERALAWCGLFLTQGSDRRLFSETPDDRCCQVCIERFGEEMARD
jgi:hypothetical protein